MTEGKVLFTVEEDEKLVEMISKFPCVYDVSLCIYKDQTVKDNAWREIAEFVEKSVEDCKKRWRNIKDTYHKRQRKGKSTGSSAPTKGKTWPLADMLTFLNQVNNKRESISNVLYEECQYEDGDASSSEISQIPPNSSTNAISSENVEDIPSFRPPSKRTRQNDKIFELLISRRTERETLLKTLAAEKRDDDVDLFFKSIASSVKKLSPKLINEAKKMSLQMVIDLDNRTSSPCNIHLCHLSPSTSSHSTTATLSTEDNATVAQCDYSQLPTATYQYL